MILPIYLLGVVLTIIYFIKKQREKSTIKLKDLIFIVFLSVFSWISLVVVYISFKTDKNKQDEKK